MAGLLDFLQSASNAVAGNVTGPVDLLTLALQKAGVPVPNNAVGSSQWARERGLLRDVEQGPARIAGETFGLLAPTVVAAKAPQIAGGLLKMAENAAVPNALNVGMFGAQRGGVPVKSGSWELVPSSEKFSSLDDADDFLYHVTSESNAKKILAGGLKPRTGSGTFNHGAYAPYSKGKAFLTDRNGVSFWQSKIEDQFFDQFDDPPAVAVLRIPRSQIKQVFDDAIGTKDARAKSFYVDSLVK